MRRGDQMARTIRQSPNSGTTTAYSPGEWARRVVATLALGLLFTITASEARAGIAFVKNIGTSASATTGTTIAVTVPAAGVAAGDSIILALAMGDASGTVSATDSKGNSYSVAADVTNAANVRTVMLAAHNVTALASGDTITVTHPSVTARGLSANEFSGLSPTSPLDQTLTATGSSATPSSGTTAATSEAAELLLGAIGVAGPTSDTFAPGTNYTALTRAGTGIGFRGATPGSVASATSLSLTRPGATAANDIMLASVTAPADMSERFNVVTSGGNSSAAASESADRVQAAAGATGSEASTGNTANISQAVALKPATPAAVTINPEYQIVGATGTYSATGTL